MKKKKRIIIGITGASGAPIATNLLEALYNDPNVETHLVISESAQLTIDQETTYTLEQVEKLANEVYPIKDMGAKISSGTFKTDGMIIVPCSMKSLAAINHGYSDNLIHRAADVTLKEKRKLVLVPRETPLNQIHLKNMYELACMGVDILPPMLSFYNKPESIQDITHHIVGKILDGFNLCIPKFRRWNGMDEKLQIV